jgi:hypothetical protein
MAREQGLLGMADDGAGAFSQRGAPPPPAAAAAAATTAALEATSHAGSQTLLSEGELAMEEGALRAQWAELSFLLRHPSPHDAQALAATVAGWCATVEASQPASQPARPPARPPALWGGRW